MKMRTRQINIALIAVMALLSGTVLGDWDAPKWVQLPDVTYFGMDVAAGSPTVVADDFLCFDPSPITDIHIWGSWLNDVMPNDNPGDVTFTLSIYSDMPADMPGGPGYSTPREPLWSRDFAPGEFAVRQYQSDLQEGWYDPTGDTFIPSLPGQGGPADTICWQYNFLIPDDPFVQEGTPSAPIIYWLAVEADVPDDRAQFGWKNSMQHFNDAAVYGIDANEPAWNKLTYPDGHFFSGDDIDMAFVITPEPASLLLFAAGVTMVRIRRKRRFSNRGQFIYTASNKNENN